MMHTHIPSPSLTVGDSSKGFGLAALVKGKNKLDTITKQDILIRSYKYRMMTHGTMNIKKNRTGAHMECK